MCPIRAAAGSLLALLASGCASVPYHYGSADQYYRAAELESVTQPQIERGQPRPVIDAVGWIIGIPSKIVLWDHRVDNHHISPDTERMLAEYLLTNELDTVKVRLNEYAPGDEWQRLLANKSVGWGWRYTFGTVAWLGYTLLPGRIWGGDNFNAYTNTVSLYSDVPAIAVHEGGHAKDFAGRNYKGTYAALYCIPGGPLWHEAQATRDALSYLRTAGSLEDEQEAYRVLYPAYGTYVGGTVAEYTAWPSLLVYAAAVIPAHILGRLTAHRIADERLPGPTARVVPEPTTAQGNAPAVSEPKRPLWPPGDIPDAAYLGPLDSPASPRGEELPDRW